jgi:hypothetical protein
MGRTLRRRRVDAGEHPSGRVEADSGVRPQPREASCVHVLRTLRCRPCALVCSRSTTTSERDRKRSAREPACSATPSRLTTNSSARSCFWDQVHHTPLRILLRWARYVGKMPLCPSTCPVSYRNVEPAHPSPPERGTQCKRALAVADVRSGRAVLDAPSSARARRRRSHPPL